MLIYICKYIILKASGSLPPSKPHLNRKCICLSINLWHFIITFSLKREAAEQKQEKVKEKDEKEEKKRLEAEKKEQKEREKKEQDARKKFKVSQQDWNSQLNLLITFEGIVQLLRETFISCQELDEA